MINILLLFTGIYLFALMDAEHFQRKQFFKDHRSRFYMRALFVLVLGQADIKITAGAGLLFYALFDAVLNSIMDWGIMSVGDTSRVDIFFLRFPILHKTLKFVCLLGGLTLMII